MSANKALRDQHMVSGTKTNKTCLTKTCLCRPNNAYRHAPVHFSNSHTGACGALVYFPIHIQHYSGILDIGTHAIEHRDSFSLDRDGGSASGTKSQQQSQRCFGFPGPCCGSWKYFLVPGHMFWTREQHSRHVFCSRGHYLIVGNDLFLGHFLARVGSSVTRTNSTSRAGVVFGSQDIFLVPVGILFGSRDNFVFQGATFQTCVLFPGPLSAHGTWFVPGAISC